MENRCLICGDVVTIREFFIQKNYTVQQTEIDNLCNEHTKMVLKYIVSILYGDNLIPPMSPQQKEEGELYL